MQLFKKKEGGSSVYYYGKISRIYCKVGKNQSAKSVYGRLLSM